jgi:hypothetical protein
MSTREQRSGLVQPRAAEVFDDDIDLLQALQFAHEQPVTPATSAPNHGVASPEWAEADTKIQQRESPAAIERRLATLRGFKELATLGDVGPTERPIIARAALEAESRRVRDSLITVPPAITSLPPPSLPPLPALRAPRITSENTVPLAPIPPAFAEAIATRTRGSISRLTWAVVMTTLGIALPGGLLLGRALTSRADAGMAEPTTRASAAAPPAPEATSLAAAFASSSEAPSAAAPATASAASSARVLSYPVDWSLAVRASRAVHHGKGKPAPKPAASAASADTPVKASATNPPRPTDAPAPVDSTDGTVP